MHIFDKETIQEAFKLKDGEEFMYEYVAAGVGYQEKAIKMGDTIYYKMERSMYNDAESGQALDCYCYFDKEENMRVAARRLDGAIEIK